jgi:arabinose-5-phosphate isomerase
MSVVTRVVPQLDDLREAQRVLSIEANALTQLSQSMDDSFSQGVSQVMALQGRLITTGMGKSGHVAQKIAATLASTGTPSFFIHPSEASHGDLGMVSPQDGVLALSNSGDTNELSDIIAYTRRYRILLVGMTTNPHSILAKHSDVTFLLPKLEEACPLGLAPTTSTTLMMALGDALATCILKRRGFTAADFRALHPGGSLGQRLTRVEQLMHGGGDIPLVSTGAPLGDALEVMSAKKFGCVGVVNSQGQLTGMITDGDLRRHFGASLTLSCVEDVMTTAPKMIQASLLAQEALSLMQAHQITSLFVVDNLETKTPVGLVHIHDFLKGGFR